MKEIVCRCGEKAKFKRKMNEKEKKFYKEGLNAEVNEVDGDFYYCDSCGMWALTNLKIAADAFTAESFYDEEADEDETFEIDVNELDKVLKLVRMEQHFAASLASYLKYVKLQKDIAEELARTAKVLRDHKDGSTTKWWRSIDPELRKVIDRYARMQ